MISSTNKSKMPYRVVKSDVRHYLKSDTSPTPDSDHVVVDLPPFEESEAEDCSNYDFDCWDGAF